MNLKPIETRYKGYRFRSRLEARWAVYLDYIGWNWEYEPEGFDLGDRIFYLPDFRIVANEDRRFFWLEIKPFLYSKDELEKARRLAQQSGETVLFGIGLPDPHQISDAGLPGFDHDCEEAKFIASGLASIDSYCFNKWGRPGYFMYGDPSPVDFEACEAARSARFEYAEGLR